MRSALTRLGLVEVGPIFAIPRVSRVAALRGRKWEVALRYPLAAELVGGGAGQSVFLRAHGSGFNIVPPEWLRADLGRVFSLGVGLAPDRGERLHALIQCFEPQPQHAAIASLLRELGAEVASCTEPEYGIPCWRVSGLFAQVAFPAAGEGAEVAP